MDGEEEVHVAPSRKANKVSIGDVEDKKRKDLHEYSDEALVDGEEEVHVAPSRTAKNVCPLRLRNPTRRATPPRINR